MIVISAMNTLQILACRFLTKFRFWNHLNPAIFRKFVLVLHWMKVALSLNLKAALSLSLKLQMENVSI